MTREEFDEYIRQGEPHKREKGYAWQTAIGLQAVDGLKPSTCLIEAARQDIEGVISIDEVERLVKSYYQSKTHRTEEEEREQEADLAATNIRRILAEKTLAFSVVGLTSIHRRIFNGIFSFAGEIRNYNITKQEWVLRGDTVLYVSATDIRQAVEHDLEQEKQFDYSHITKDELIQHLTKFVADLWQIHPFGEGNTRTTAVFTILYLRSLGFNVENDLFARYSWYFRNALVRANYQNIEKGIVRNSTFLEKFFRNLLLGENNELHNRYMLVAAPDDSIFSANNRTSTAQVRQTTSPNEMQRKLMSVLVVEPLSLRQAMEAVGLKHRATFIQNYITPSIQEGYIQLLYPDNPNHPRQKYKLTVKGIATLNNNNTTNHL